MQRLYMGLRKGGGGLTIAGAIGYPPRSPSKEGICYWLVGVGCHGSNGFFVDLWIVFDWTMT